MRRKIPVWLHTFTCIGGLILLSGSSCSDPSSTVQTVSDTGSDGPVSSEAPVVHQTGNAINGQAVFRFETFGNEGFWTDALKLQQGMMQAGLTPLQALKLGLTIDSDALPPAMLTQLAAEFKTDLSPAKAPLLNNPATLIAIMNANAVIGLPVKDSNGDGTEHRQWRQGGRELRHVSRNH